ncbi:carotenoid biosynthesis protein [Bacillus tianshenii]|uniref:carotenoid biosynthesis protein n=1 Tax=Sutcliffiella tianshenii TaxID=1463404 RepID=UPI001CD5B015|nr:carotenoid biosynthesis protein [Bacillus tianshenii]MCA1320125.1 carotenoid biosynthesis protein [Bacillus tianshenii]
MVSKWERNVFHFFILWYICGVILLTFDLLPPWLEWANVVFLVTAGSLGAIYFIKNYKTLGFLFTLIVFFSSIAAEHIGVKYGLLFGDYYYNSYFGPMLFGVPVTIGFAWVMVIATSHVMALRIFPDSPLLLKATVAALAAVVLDLIIDPVAFIAKEYWIWSGESFYYNIPMFNFYSWFGLSLLFHLVLLLLTSLSSSKENRYWEKNMFLLYGLMVGMFCLIALSSQLYLAFFATIIPAILLYGGTYKNKELFHDTSQKKQSI